MPLIVCPRILKVSVWLHGGGKRLFYTSFRESWLIWLRWVRDVKGLRWCWDIRPKVGRWRYGDVDVVLKWC